MKALLEPPCGFAPLPWEPGAQGSSLDPSQRCKNCMGRWERLGSIALGGFNAKSGLDGCMGLEMIEAESSLYFSHVFLIRTCFPWLPP